MVEVPVRVDQRRDGLVSNPFDCLLNTRGRVGIARVHLKHISRTGQNGDVTTTPVTTMLVTSITPLFYPLNFSI